MFLGFNARMNVRLDGLNRWNLLRSDLSDHNKFKIQKAKYKQTLARLSKIAIKGSNLLKDFIF
jgi:hypothetical protein